MNAAASTERTTGLPIRAHQREARRWIQRQLRWERTLGTLRGREHHPASRAA